MSRRAQSRTEHPVRARAASVLTRVLVLAALAPATTRLSACGPVCQDTDEDGYGAHCPLGPDCDDANAARTVDCVNVPPPDCAARPESTGCACTYGQVRDCYSGPTGTEDVGPCKGGRTLCTTGTFGLCLGEQTPLPELCNGLDEDCDGTSDEDVSSPCGGCNVTCEGSVHGPLGEPFAMDAGLALTDEGYLELARTTHSFDGIWVPNTAEGTVSHVSRSAWVEVGRHASGGAQPTRVAVDHVGDVFVSNRAPGGQGVLTKLAGVSARCVDRDGDRAIRTSTGPADVPGVGADECVLFSVPLGATGEAPRALLVDGSFDGAGGGGGDVWVGLHGGEAIVHVDGATGAVLERLPVPGFRPYAAARDERGALYFSSQEGEIVTVDRRTAPPTVTRTLLNLACYSTYGIAVPEAGEVLGAGFACNSLYRATPASGVVFRSAVRANARGVAVADGLGYVAHTDGYLSVVDPHTLLGVANVDLFALGVEPIECTGVFTDDAGGVYVASGQTTSGGDGVLTRIDATTRTVTHQLRLGAGPHVLGDATGDALGGAFGPSGVASARSFGCTNGAETRWERLHLDVGQSALGAVKVEIRSAGSEAELAAAGFTTLTDAAADGRSVLDLATVVPRGFVVELRLTLSTETRDASPLLRGAGLEYDCEVIVE